MSNAWPWRCAALGALCAILQGCAGGEPEAEPDKRQLAGGGWETLWEVSAGGADSLLARPSSVTSDGELAYVADSRTAHVVAFALADGALRWRSPLRMPGEASPLGAVSLSPRVEGGVTVADERGGKLVFFDRAGTRERALSYPKPLIAPSVCNLADRSVLVSTAVIGRPFLHLNRAGGELAAYSVVMPDGTEPTRMQAQTTLASTAGGRGCVAAFRVGPGFLVFDGARLGPLRPYVEAIGFPEVERKKGDGAGGERLLYGKGAASAIATRGDTLLVLFGGKSSRASRVLDFYDLEDGAYLHSLELPLVARAFANTGDTYLFLGMKGGFPVLLAARPWPGAPPANAAPAASGKASYRPH